jgi:hypothetical protein
MDRPLPEYEPLLVLKFSRGTHDYRSQKVSEKYFFGENSYKYISGFPRFLDVLIGQKSCWKNCCCCFKKT